jgi:UDP-N-acetylglucosamine acyltransferase
MDHHSGIDQSGIHPTAVVDPGATLGAHVSVGAYSVIGADVEIGDDSVIGPHVVIQGPTKIGREARIFQFASVGADPQDKKFKGERTHLVIGDRAMIREFVTINRGTGDGGGTTRIGNDNWIMAYCHIAHDCQVGDNVVFSNGATLAGHVEVGDHVIFSGYSGAHQFCRIGSHAFLAMGTHLNGDLPPFMLAGVEYGRPRGINSEGLKRRGFSPERIAAIRRAYKTIYTSGLTLEEAKSELTRIASEEPDVKAMLDFINSGQRPLFR